MSSPPHSPGQEAVCSEAGRFFRMGTSPGPGLLVRVRQRLLLLAVALLCLAGAIIGAPSDLVVVRTAGSGPELQEAINRLRGELSQHGFSVQVVDVPEPPTTSELEERADQAGAVASVLLVASGDQLDELESVDVWMSDRVTGKTLKRTLSPSGSGDGPTVLAVRTLELLRSSLEEYHARREDPAEIKGAHPERASRAVTDLRGRRQRGSWVFGAGVTFGHSLPDGEPSLAPQASVAYDLRKLGSRLVVIAPLLGAEPRVPAGHFEVLSISALVEPYYQIVAREQFRLEGFPVIGATFLDVRGNVDPPFVGQRDSTWLVTIGAGVSARLLLGPQFGFYADLRALVLLPRPVVEIGTETRSLGSPLLTAGAGLVMTL